MLYKILLVLGIVYFVRSLFKFLGEQQVDKINPHQDKRADKDTVDAEYRVIDDE